MTYPIRKGVWVAAFALVLTGAAQAMSPVLREIEDAFIRIGEQVRPCVVNIDSEQPTEPVSEDQMKGLEDFFRQFGIPMPEQMPRRMPRSVASGSGFIIDKEGHILTNNHVVEGAKNIKVRLSTGKVYDAEIVGLDSDTDIAVIKITPEGDLPIAELGDSSQIRVGQFAIAVGNPRGLEGTVSFGHVSALGRESLGLPSIRFQDFIQTDAAINLGNSGGPLCDIEGRVIGINTAIFYGAESLGFAIPINMAKEIVPQLLSKGKVTRGFLGVDISDVEDVAKEAGAESVEDFIGLMGLPDAKGAYVRGAHPNSPAERAGVKSEDVIREVNGAPVENSKDLVAKISAFAPGADVKIGLFRDKKMMDVSVQLTEYAGSVEKARLGGDILGMRLEELSQMIIKQHGFDENTKGVLVTDVLPDSPAERCDIAPGDVITEVAQQAVASMAEFRSALKANATPGKSVLLRVLRPGERSMPKVIKIPDEGVPGL
ncbi:MAG: trypsin-like peptidase domain-containing protein [Candidatus Hydrogenedentes bacterium]|nr:trypsin-like peptidase domain-containing protein [Candidatus Hydrogenedentota bacterium]